jgi:glyoxylase-like metal-dependent hydrolase (beta-lactamase superfamily II)
VIYTPGHSTDHICLYEPDCGWLFSGDLYVGGRDRALSADADICGVIASLKRIADLPLSRLLPGSARVRENPQNELREKITYLDEIGVRVQELYCQGKSVPAIVNKLFSGPMWIELVTLGHFSRRNLVRSYLQKFETGI